MGGNNKTEDVGDINIEDVKNAGDVVDPRGSATLIAAEYQKYEGPLPHPDHLEKYENTMPGAADRVFAMLEKEQAHRHTSHNEIVQSVIKRERWGQISGTLLAIIGFATAIILSYIGNPLYGAGLGTALIASITGIFWRVSKNNDNSNDKGNNNDDN